MSEIGSRFLLGIDVGSTAVKVAAFERVVRLISLWSMVTTLSTCSHPWIESCSPGTSRAP